MVKLGLLMEAFKKFNSTILKASVMYIEKDATLFMFVIPKIMLLEKSI
jgi:hypothetical protein